MDRHAQGVMLQLAKMNHRLIMLHEEVQARQSEGAKVSGSIYGYPQTDGYNLGTLTNLLEDSSSFFNYMKMEPRRGPQQSWS